MNGDTPDADDEPWIIPLHGIEAPGEWKLAPPPPVDDSAAAESLYDDELPTLEFRPRLRRSA